MNRDLWTVLREAIQTLDEVGVNSPRSEVEWLACSILNCSRANLYSGLVEFDNGSYQTFEEMLRRRVARVPVQHILARTTFRNLDLAIDQRAMIPRPETELLTGIAIEHLLSRERPSRVLDLCTGSGVIALAIASEVEQVEVWATDVSPQALELARQNSHEMGLEGTVNFEEGDLFEALPFWLRGTFDVIAVNPPYVPSGQLPELEPEVRDFDPRIALDGGPDGLSLIRRILCEASQWMADSGLLLVELGVDHYELARSMGQDAGLVVGEAVKDYSGVDRFLIATPARFQ